MKQASYSHSWLVMQYLIHWLSIQITTCNSLYIPICYKHCWPPKHEFTVNREIYRKPWNVQQQKYPCAHQTDKSISKEVMNTSLIMLNNELFHCSPSTKKGLLLSSPFVHSTYFTWDMLSRFIQVSWNRLSRFIHVSWNRLSRFIQVSQ